MVSVDVKQLPKKKKKKIPELRSWVKVEVAVLGSLSLIIGPYGLFGRKATLKLN